MNRPVIALVAFCALFALVSQAEEGQQPGHPAELVRALEATADHERALDALVLAFEASAAERPSRVEALGALGDPRLVAALGYFATQDREVAVRLAGAKTLGAFSHPKAEAAARAILADRKEMPLVRIAAVESLAAQGTPSAGDALGALALDADEKGEVRQAAGDALRARYPELAERLQIKTKIAGSSGRGVSTVVGAASGAYTLSLVGMLSPSELTGALVGGFGGLVVGGVSGNLLARAYDVDTGDALFIGSAGLWSAPTGWFLGRLAGGPEGDCDNACTAIMLGTHALAMGGSWLLRDHVGLSLLDTVELNAAAATGLALAYGLTQLPTPRDDVRPGLGVMAALPVAGFVAGTLFADELELSPPSMALAGLSVLEGLYLGHFLGKGFIRDDIEASPGVFEPNVDKVRQVGALRWVGLGLGLGGALAGSAFWQPSASDVQLIGYGALIGHVLGAGAALLKKEDVDRTMVSSAFAGLALSAGVGLLTGPLELNIAGGDALVIPLGLAFSAWQGIGWGNRMADAGYDIDPWGLGFVVAGAGGLATLGLSQFTQVSAWKAAWAFSGGVWGGWLGGWGAFALSASDKAVVTTALVGSGLGLAVSALLVSPLVGIDPTRLAWTTVFGVAGMTLASMTAVFVAYDATSEARTVSTANVIGSVVGLATGAFVSGWLIDLGAGSDIRLPGGLDVPAPSVGLVPVFDPDGSRIDGMGASFTWAL